MHVPSVNKIPDDESDKLSHVIQARIIFLCVLHLINQTQNVQLSLCSFIHCTNILNAYSQWTNERLTDLTAVPCSNVNSHKWI